MSKKFEPPHEEHADETWLVPYSDLLTLLLALFVVLFASSKLDAEKFAQVASSFHQSIGGTSGLNNGSPSVLDGGLGIMSTTDVMSPAELESSQLESAQEQIEQYVSQSDPKIDVETVVTDQGLVVRIRDNALYASGSAELNPDGIRFADMVSDILKKIPQNVLISGHTDNVPISTAQYPSNWELSSIRAINLMKYILNANPEISPARMSAIGFGEYRSVATNDTEEGRSKNRRVEILVQRSYSQGKKVESSLINPTSNNGTENQENATQTN
jgi:Flagellar motor protein